MTCQRSRGASGGWGGESRPNRGAQSPPCSPPSRLPGAFWEVRAEGREVLLHDRALGGLGSPAAKCQVPAVTPLGAAVPRCDLPRQGPGQRPACMWLWAAAPLSPGTRSSASRPSWTPGSWPSTEPGSEARTHRAGFGGWQTQQEVGGAKGEKTATFFPFLSRIHASHPAFKEEGVCLINSKAVEPAPEARGARLLAVGQAWRAAFCLSHLTSSAQ